MISEQEIIAILDAQLPSARTDGLFAADAEHVPLAASDYLFSMDEFSNEDRFVERDPVTLGWNVAVGALSDILACGGIPRYYLHALCVGEEWDRRTIEGFGEGVRQALSATGAQFLGGDCGRSHQWRCTVTAIGQVGERRLTRMGASVGDGLYLTGPVGSGNLQAALSLGGNGSAVKALLSGAVPRFPLRTKESGLLRRFASACMDTSDGLLAAADTLARLNGCGFHLENIPFLSMGRLFARLSSLPRVLLALAGCGEYELLATVPSDREAAFCNEAHRQGLRFFRVGSLAASGRHLIDKGRDYDLSRIKLDPRSFADPREYLGRLTMLLKEAF